jgi:hypothetical protein
MVGVGVSLWIRAVIEGCTYERLGGGLSKCAVLQPDGGMWMIKKEEVRMKEVEEQRGNWG